MTSFIRVALVVIALHNTRTLTKTKDFWFVVLFCFVFVVLFLSLTGLSTEKSEEHVGCT